MTTCFLAPDPIQSKQFIPGGIVPANGGQLFFYLAGTTTKTTVYKDDAAGTAWTNPIVLDSGGDLPLGGEVWIAQGIVVKVVFAPSTDTDPPVSPYWSKDDLTGINDISTISGAEWIAGPVPSFVSGTSLRVSGDQRDTFDVGRHLLAVVTAGSSFPFVSSSVFATGSTTIGINTSNTIGLDAGLSAVSYSVLNGTHPSVPLLLGGQPLFRDAAVPSKTVGLQTSSIPSSTDVVLTVNVGGIQDTLASSIAATTATLNLDTVNGKFVPITGTTTISQYTLAAGAMRTVEYASTVGLTNGTSIVIGASFTTAAGDVHLLAGSSSGTVKTLSYWPPPAEVGASLNLLNSITVPTAGTTHVAFTDDLSSYNYAEIIVTNMTPVTGAQTFLFEVSTSNGVSWIATAAQYANAFTAFDQGGNTRTVVGALDHLNISDTTNGMSNASAYQGRISIWAPNTTGYARSFTGECSYIQAGTASPAFGRIGGNYTSVTSPVNAVRFLMTSGNISTGTFALYARKKS